MYADLFFASTASALNKLGGNGLAGWRYIFIVEGALTIVAGMGAYFILVDSVETAWVHLIVLCVVNTH